MNKKANLVLNIVELVGICLIGLCLVSAMAIDFPIGGFNNLSHLNIIKSVIFFGSLTILAIIVSVELFLFLNYKLKYKFLYILFLLVDLVITLYINESVPFFGAVVAFAFCLFKFVLRLSNVSKFYLEDRFYEYCKLYHIPIKKETKRKRTTKAKVVVDKKDSASSVSSKKKKAVAA